MSRLQYTNVKICDDLGQGCFVPHVVVHPAPWNRSFSSSSRHRPLLEGIGADILSLRQWNDQHVLAPVFLAALRGTCMRAGSGHRKIVVDVGAHVGLYSLYFAKRGCDVHAAEPLAHNALAIEQAAHDNRIGGDRLHVYRTLVGSHAGAVPLRYTLRKTDATHARHADRPRAIPEARSDWMESRAFSMSLDALVRRNAIGAPARAGVAPGTIDLLKVNAGGAELDVLQSARIALRRTRWLLLAINPKAMPAGAVGRLQALLERSRFRPWPVEGLTPWKWSDLTGRKPRSINAALFRYNATTG